MMKAVTASQMQALDRKAIEEYGIPSLLLMENAGRGVAKVTEQILGRRGGSRAAPTLHIFCGKGNNGGDGFVAARHLWNRGYRVKIVLMRDPSELKSDAALNHRIASKMKIPIVIASFANDKLLECVKDCDLIIDAIFGIGLQREVGGIYRQAIHAMNQSKKPMVAVDVPSGLESDSGKILGCCVNASVTATLGLPKKGLFMGEGPRHAGKVSVIDIGIPKELLT